MNVLDPVIRLGLINQHVPGDEITAAVYAGDSMLHV